ncbi:MAG: nodulation protein NfeD [Firmicutes bacterium]|nr:nodulation protein NfeD [Bacillota bacterium]
MPAINGRQRVGRKAIAAVITCLVIGWLAMGVSEAAGGVWLIPIRGTVEWGLSGFVQRAVREAEAQRASAILVEINTFGGRLDAAVEIRDTLLASSVPVAALVTDRAWSAGALIALAAEHLAMAPGASIGAAEPNPPQEKTISAVRGEFEATAQRWGRDPKIAAAMVEQDLEIPGLVTKGKILTLTAEQAKELGFIDFLASHREELLEQLGYSNERLVELRPTAAEKAAGFITQPIVSSLLLIVGFAGIVFEVLTPGFGVPGTVGGLSLVLFFGGRLLTGLAGWEVIILLIGGLVLLAVEAFILPGFGIAGIAGLAAVFASIILSYTTSAAGLISLNIALAATIVLVALGWRHIRKSSRWQRLVLSTRLERESGSAEPKTSRHLVGKVGQAQTPLRPAGIVEIAGQRIDVVTEGGFVAKGTAVEVITVQGNRVVVRPVKPDDPAE